MLNVPSSTHTPQKEQLSIRAVSRMMNLAVLPVVYTAPPPPACQVSQSLMTAPLYI